MLILAFSLFTNKSYYVLIEKKSANIENNLNDHAHMTGEIQMGYKFEGGFLLLMLIQLLNALRKILIS